MMFADDTDTSNKLEQLKDKDVEPLQAPKELSYPAYPYIGIIRFFNILSYEIRLSVCREGAIRFCD